jgi:hypothetical protein
MISANILNSAGSFRKSRFEKLSFLVLGELDFGLTLLAVTVGLSEQNPLMRNLLMAPAYLILVKVVAPIFIAWLTPGKLLIPAIVLLGFIIGWDMKELVAHFL